MTPLSVEVVGVVIAVLFVAALCSAILLNLEMTEQVNKQISTSSSFKAFFPSRGQLRVFGKGGLLALHESIFPNSSLGRWYQISFWSAFVTWVAAHVLFFVEQLVV